MAYNPNTYLNDQTNKINDIYEAQKRSQLASLQQARAKALGEQNTQLNALKPQYQDLRNQADVTSIQNQNRMRETMAANGLASSGENVTATSNLLNSRQQALGQLNNQEQEARNTINRKIADINDPNEENSLLSQLEAKKLEALMNLRQQVSEQEYQDSRDSKSSGLSEEQLAAILNQQSQSQLDPAPEELAKYVPGKGVLSTYNINKQKKLFDY